MIQNISTLLTKFNSVCTYVRTYSHSCTYVLYIRKYVSTYVCVYFKRQVVTCTDESWKKTTLKKTTGMSSKEIETIGMAKELIHEEVSMGFCTCSHENEVCIIYGIMYIHTYCTMLKTSHPISMYAFEYVFCIYVCVRTSSVCPFLFVINSSMHSCLYMSLYQLM